MQLAKVRQADGREAVAVIEGDSLAIVPANERFATLSDLLEAPDPAATAKSLMSADRARVKLTDVELLAPIDQQEVWAAGVTYRRSQVARMEESQGAASFYDKVYVAKRPELFFKATPHRVRGPGQAVRIRADASWNVPEPELALAINSRLELVGFTDRQRHEPRATSRAKTRSIFPRPSSTTEAARSARGSRWRRRCQRSTRSRSSWSSSAAASKLSPARRRSVKWPARSTT